MSFHILLLEIHLCKKCAEFFSHHFVMPFFFCQKKKLSLNFSSKKEKYLEKYKISYSSKYFLKTFPINFYQNEQKIIL